MCSKGGCRPCGTPVCGGVVDMRVSCWALWSPLRVPLLRGVVLCVSACTIVVSKKRLRFLKKRSVFCKKRYVFFQHALSASAGHEMAIREATVHREDAKAPNTAPSHQLTPTQLFRQGDIRPRNTPCVLLAGSLQDQGKKYSRAKKYSTAHYWLFLNFQVW